MPFGFRLVPGRDRSETRSAKMLVMTSRDFTGEIDGSFGEAQFPMQTSKGTGFRDLPENLEGVSPDDRANDALFPVKTTFGMTSTSLDKMRSMTRAYGSVKSYNLIFSQRFPFL